MCAKRVALSFLFVLFIFSSVAATATPVLQWQPEGLEVRQMQGTQGQYSVRVEFLQSASTVNAWIVPELQPWVSVSPVSYGDVASGDILDVEITVTVPEGEVTGQYDGVLQLRSGENQSNLAKPLNLVLIITPQTADGLPPDPGEAGKETLLGIDSDSDGVRDDIQRYIVLTYPDQPNMQGALFQISRTYQKILDPDLVSGQEVAIAREINRGIECLYFINEGSAYKFLLSLKAEALNTISRTHKYLSYDSKLAGETFSSSRLPLNEHYKLCEFELQ